MVRVTLVVLASALLGTGAKLSSTPVAWPHRAWLTALHQRPVAFRAYTLGGTFIVAVDAAGRPTTSVAGSRIRALTATDTIRAETPANFPLDLAKGPVVFIAEGSDSLQLVVSRNPNGSDQVSANGRRFMVRLVGDRFVIDSR